MRFLVWILTLISIFGCSSKEFYTIGDISDVERGAIDKQEFIGVEQVEVPAYLMSSPIYIKRSSYHLDKLDGANWVNSMDEQLTSILIAYLQKYMDNPNIYLYPWSGVDKIDKRLSLTINDFIASKFSVHLSARYRVLDRKSKGMESHIFDIEESIDGHEIEDMVRAMEMAYFKLIQDIAKNL